MTIFSTDLKRLSSQMSDARLITANSRIILQPVWVLAALFICLLQMPSSVLAQQAGVCNGGDAVNPVATTTSNQTLFTHQFDSGAHWSLCWHIDDKAGLTLTDVSYGAPEEPQRMVLRQGSVGQILLQYDEDTRPTSLVSDIGLGNARILQDSPSLCDDGQILTSSGATMSVCSKQRDVNLMTQTRNDSPTRRHQVSLHSWSRIDNFIYQIVWRLSEDGEIAPAIELSGQLSRFTSDPRFGSPVGRDAQLASNATWVSTWRLEFAINGDEDPDVIEEIQFPFNITEVVRRPLQRRQLLTETLRQVDPEQFRGWVVRDSTATSTTVLGNDGNPINHLSYFLDPQPSGFAYSSQTNNWAGFDIAVTVARNCEQLASGNSGFNPNTVTSDDCASNLDFYTDGEPLSNGNIVVWYSLARHLTPSREDIPAIASRQAAFRLQPFDWSPFTRFDTAREEP